MSCEKKEFNTELDAKRKQYAENMSTALDSTFNGSPKKLPVTEESALNESPTSITVIEDDMSPSKIITIKDDSRHAKYKTKEKMTEGLLDIGLLMANVSQLKTIINVGPELQKFYLPNLVFILTSLILQVFIGFLLLILGTMDDENMSPKGKRVADILDSLSIAIVFAITVINVFIVALGVGENG